jgi:1-acyl-sn-glycerol-3-phosphate acyltransferase
MDPQQLEQLLVTAREALRNFLGLEEDDQLVERLVESRKDANQPEFDPFGYHPESIRYVAPFARFLYRYYFRVEVFGLENLPPGRLLLISNHSGQIPLDAMMIATSLLLSLPKPRLVRSMIEKWVPQIPFVSYLFARWGQVVGIPENCSLLLQNGEAILVFPEGVRGINKTFDKRYQLQEFGLGFMRLALENKTPIVPVAVIGAEEQAPALFNFKSLAKMIGAPAFPITPTFPLVPLLGLLPYPVKYRIYFGKPTCFVGDPQDDDSAIEAKVQQVKDEIQQMIEEGLAQRKSWFY